MGGGGSSRKGNIQGESGSTSRILPGGERMGRHCGHDCVNHGQLWAPGNPGRVDEVYISACRGGWTETGYEAGGISEGLQAVINFIA